jgi:hypothetical protein
MQPHQQRVVDERTELDEKLTKLTQFIAESPIFAGLDDREKSRLIAQKAHMEGYSDILGERIAAF